MSAPAALTATPERCLSARVGLHWYRTRYISHQLAREAGVESWRKPRNCADARYLSRVWRKRSYRSRLKAQNYRLSLKTLKNTPFGNGNRAWPRAVKEVQRIFPGTESWLLSCSAAEGGHGRWVGYSGVSYSTWLRDSDTVGGPLQFRFSTFTSMYRRAVNHAVGRGYKVPRMTFTSAWRSALGQALAGGWARWSGNDNNHWSASFGRGC